MRVTFTLMFLTYFIFCSQAQLNLSYISDFSYAQEVNDVWGYVDPDDGTEYALVGTETGTSIVSLADTSTPAEVAFIPGDQSTWRDLKTWSTYAFVTCDTGDDGLTIIDLSNLPESVESRQLTDLPIGELSTCHNIYIDEFGYAYLAGCNLNDGGVLLLDCFTDPYNPRYVASAPAIYSHDVYARENKLYSSEIFEGVFSIYDVTDKDAIGLLGTQNTPSNFTHNTWLSDDGNILFTTDERGNAYCGAYDISDPEDIVFLDGYRPLETVGTGVVPHNVHVWGNWLVISHYSDGCKIVDATYPDNLVEVGSFDTFLEDEVGFNGAWGAYPFLPSGVVLVSDRSSGLYVLEPNYIQAGYLHGEVTNALDGNAVVDARISLLTTSTFADTDVTGKFKTGIATGGGYDIEVSKPGYENTMTRADIVNGEITSITVELTPLPSFSVSGTVINAMTKEPVPNINVSVIGSEFIFEEASDVSGNFSFPTVFEDNYTIYAGLWGYKTNILFDQYLDNSNNNIIIEIEKGFEDNFSLDLGWAAASSATIGGWDRGEPTVAPGPDGFIIPSPDEDIPDDIGNDCYATGITPTFGGSAVFSGSAFLTSPSFDLSAYNSPMLQYYYWHFNQALGGGASPDKLTVRLSNGIESVIVAEYDSSVEGNVFWNSSEEIRIDEFIEPTDFMTFEIEAAASGFNLTESALDYWRVWDANPVSVKDRIDTDIKLTIAPNPSDNTFQMAYDIGVWKGTSMTLELTNLLGQKMEEISLETPKAKIILGANLPTGIYFAQITDSSRKSRVMKLIKR